jgi:anti-sigma regulatory factor (Ser/Thr protein kinase)
MSFRQLSLAALPTAAPGARRFLQRALRKWDLDGLCGTAELAVSELVTNAIRASESHRIPGRPVPFADMITVTLRIITGTALLTEVWDASPQPPVLQDAAPTDDGGRGLLIVEYLARNWGHYPADGGKVVWCELELAG